MKELRSAYVSACVPPNLKQRLEAIASMEKRSLSQVAGWAINEGILALERSLVKHYTHPDGESANEESPYFDAKEILAKQPYDAKKAAGRERSKAAAERRVERLEREPENKKLKGQHIRKLRAAVKRDIR